MNDTKSEQEKLFLRSRELFKKNKIDIDTAKALDIIYTKSMIRGKYERCN